MKVCGTVTLVQIKFKVSELRKIDFSSFIANIKNKAKLEYALYKTYAFSEPGGQNQGCF